MKTNNDNPGIGNEKFEIIFKSDFSICMASPPRYGIIDTYNDEDKHISRKVFGKQAEIYCPYCNKLWSKHEGYVSRPKEFEL